jgi:hypothetical protein
MFAKLTNNIDSGFKEYTVINNPLKDKSKDMNYCLPGCVRGSCKPNNQKNSCKYGFQCQYCQDLKTNMFYVDFNDEREIIPLYEEDKKLNYRQKNRLNESIEKNNKYIELLNKKIMLMNS